MKTHAKFTSLLAAIFFAFVGSSFGQIVTFQTQTGYGGDTTTFVSNNKVEVFKQVEAITKLTFNFFTGSGGALTQNTSLTATLGEWNGSGFVGGTTVNQAINVSTTGWTNTLSYVNSSNQTVVVDSNKFNTSATLDFTGATTSLLDSTYGYLTNPAKSYAVMLTFNSGDNNLALGANTASSFTSGYQNPFNPDLFGAGFNGYDYVFAAISVVPQGGFSPVPESSTVAAILGCVLVAGLVGFRLRQQRQLTAAPVVAA